MKRHSNKKAPGGGNRMGAVERVMIEADHHDYYSNNSQKTQSNFEPGEVVN